MYIYFFFDCVWLTLVNVSVLFFVDLKKRIIEFYVTKHEVTAQQFYHFKAQRDRAQNIRTPARTKHIKCIVLMFAQLPNCSLC